jgi:hypothetical protein
LWVLVAGVEIPGIGVLARYLSGVSFLLGGVHDAVGVLGRAVHFR